ncbi:MAG: RagB/SusD family nutrient uptake outer membrane protein [Bacteroidota bacterium]
MFLVIKRMLVIRYQTRQLRSNQYVLRLADVYLIYAEATIGAGSSTSDPLALQYYNAIRTRAGLSTKTSITYEEIYNERRVEFGMEGMNFFDVKRRFYREGHTIGSWFLINGELRNYKYQLIDNSADDIERNTMAAYELVAPTTPVVPTVEKMFLPIPATDVISNPLLAPTEEAVDYVLQNE